MPFHGSRYLPLAVCVWVTLACTKTEEQGDTESLDSGSTEQPATFGEPYHLSITVPDVAPGTEGTMCTQVRLGNSEPVKIGKVHNVLSQSSHHLIVSSVEDSSETEAPNFECAPFRAALIGAPLTITQKHDDVILPPEGVAFPLSAGQLMHLEMHYINNGLETADVHAESDLYPLLDDSEVQEASFLIVGNLDISIPPHASRQTDPAFVTVPDAFDGVTFYAATGHTHRFGTSVELSTADDASDPGVSRYAPSEFDWAEPELKVFSEPFHIPAGGGFRFRCGWTNPTDKTITYGESALQEMCFFWTYYYPRRQGPRAMLAGLTKSPYKKDAGDD